MVAAGEVAVTARSVKGLRWTIQVNSAEGLSSGVYNPRESSVKARELGVGGEWRSET